MGTRELRSGVGGLGQWRPASFLFLCEGESASSAPNGPSSIQWLRRIAAPPPAFPYPVNINAMVRLTQLEEQGYTMIYQ